MVLTIKNKSYVCHLRDVEVFKELPLANVRKIWRLMFDEAWINQQVITDIRDWLSYEPEITGAFLYSKEAGVSKAATIAETSQKAAAVFSSVISKKILSETEKTAKHKLRAAEAEYKSAKRVHEKVLKLRDIFNLMATKYQI